jgi:hypothetical protein
MGNWIGSILLLRKKRIKIFAQKISPSPTKGACFLLSFINFSKFLYLFIASAAK